jgi:CDP-diacylglycerol---glycerol-3-phosphate 3-phosphatidyltransferase
MNLPNKLTLLRILLTFMLMFFLFVSGWLAKAFVLFLFVAACVTDFLDGWIARTRGQVSDFGKIMDPIADKILVLGVFLSFVQMQLVPAWMVVIVIIRESVITGLRFLAVRRGRVLAAESAGKHKTVSQMMAILLILIFLLVKEAGIQFSFWQGPWEQTFHRAILIMMGAAVALTIMSGVSYFWKNRHLIRSL